MIGVAKYGPWALIVGGSEGVGEEFARELAANGFNLALVARKVEALEILAERLRVEFVTSVRTLALDMSGFDAPQLLTAAFSDIDIGLLIYNAGAGGALGPFIERPFEAAARVVALNVGGATALCHHYGAAMAKRGQGGIMLVGSGAGEAGTANLAAYSAAKAYQRVLAEALWQELAPHGVDVMILVLGVTRTPQLGRIGFPIDDRSVPASDPLDVAIAGLAYLGEGPVYYAAETAEMARALRSLDRAAATRFLSGKSAATVPAGGPGQT